MDNLFAADIQRGVRWVVSVRTVGVFRWVFERTMSRKSFAVGTGAMALSPLVDIVGGDQGFFSFRLMLPYWEMIGRTLAESRVQNGPVPESESPPADPR